LVFEPAHLINLMYQPRVHIVWSSVWPDYNWFYTPSVHIVWFSFVWI